METTTSRRRTATTPKAEQSAPPAWMEAAWEHYLNADGFLKAWAPDRETAIRRVYSAQNDFAGLFAEPVTCLTLTQAAKAFGPEAVEALVATVFDAVGRELNAPYAGEVTAEAQKFARLSVSNLSLRSLPLPSLLVAFHRLLAGELSDTTWVRVSGLLANEVSPLFQKQMPRLLNEAEDARKSAERRRDERKVAQAARGEQPVEDWEPSEHFAQRLGLPPGTSVMAWLIAAIAEMKLPESKKRTFPTYEQAAARIWPDGCPYD